MCVYMYIGVYIINGWNGGIYMSMWVQCTCTCTICLPSPILSGFGCNVQHLLLLLAAILLTTASPACSCPKNMIIPKKEGREGGRERETIMVMTHRLNICLATNYVCTQLHIHWRVWCTPRCRAAHRPISPPHILDTRTKGLSLRQASCLSLSLNYT